MTYFNHTSQITDEQVFEAMLDSIRSGSLPTLEILCDKTGLRAKSAIKHHLERLVECSKVVRFGAHYLPAFSVCAPERERGYNGHVRWEFVKW